MLQTEITVVFQMHAPPHLVHRGTSSHARELPRPGGVGEVSGRAAPKRWEHIIVGIRMR